MGTATFLDEMMIATILTPVCAACGRVRDPSGRWHHLEPAALESEEDLVTHTICPECIQRLYPELVERRRRQRKPD